MSIRINGVDRASQLHDPSSFIHDTYHMGANTNLYEPQRISDFEFVVTDLENLVALGTNTVIPNAQELLRLAVISCPIPHFTQDVINIRRGNGTLKFAGVPTFDAGTVVIQDWIGANTKEICMAWQHLSYDVITQKVGLASDYKKDCYLVEYTPDKQKVRQWKLYGCWISGLSEGTYSHSEGGANNVTMTIQYDSAQLDTTDVN